MVLLLKVTAWYYENFSMNIQLLLGFWSCLYSQHRGRMFCCCDLLQLFLQYHSFDWWYLIFRSNNDSHQFAFVYMVPMEGIPRHKFCVRGLGLGGLEQMLLPNLTSSRNFPKAPRQRPRNFWQRARFYVGVRWNNITKAYKVYINTWLLLLVQILYNSNLLCKQSNL